MKSFHYYHLVDCDGDRFPGSFENLRTARDAAKFVKEQAPSLAPITIHKVTSTAIERFYAHSGTRYNPADARTMHEKRIKGGAL